MSSVKAMNTMLAELQRLATAAGAGSQNKAMTGAASQNSAAFSGLLHSAMENVNRRQQRSSELSQAFQMGDESVDLASVMVASAQSKLAFQALLQTRKRLTAAYKEVMNMPL